MKGIILTAPFFKPGYNDGGLLFLDDHFCDSSFSSTPGAARWLTGTAATGTVSLTSNAVGGIATIATSAVAGEHTSIRLNGEPFLIRPGYKAYCETRFKTSNIDAGFYFGFANDTDDPYFAGAGPADGLGLIKDGTSTLKLIGRSGSSGSAVTIADVTFAAATYTSLAIQWDGEKFYSFYVDGYLKAKVTSSSSGFTAPSATASMTLVCAAEPTTANARSLLNDRIMVACEGAAE
jgi:hypothetical protein